MGRPITQFTVYIGPIGNTRHSHRLYDPMTRTIISRPQFKPINAIPAAWNLAPRLSLGTQARNPRGGQRYPVMLGTPRLPLIGEADFGMGSRNQEGELPHHRLNPVIPMSVAHGNRDPIPLRDRIQIRSLGQEGEEERETTQRRTVHPSLATLPSTRPNNNNEKFKRNPLLSTPPTPQSSFTPRQLTPPGINPDLSPPQHRNLMSREGPPVPPLYYQPPLRTQIETLSPPPPPGQSSNTTSQPPQYGQPNPRPSQLPISIQRSRSPTLRSSTLESSTPLGDQIPISTPTSVGKSSLSTRGITSTPRGITSTTPPDESGLRRSERIRERSGSRPDYAKMDEGIEEPPGANHCVTTSEEYVICNHMSIRKALEDKDKLDSTTKSINDEIENIHRSVLPVHLSDIPKSERGAIIPCQAFVTHKTLATGVFDKTKTRIVLLGNLQSQDSIEETRSPTVNPISVMTQLQATVQVSTSRLASYDVKQAFTGTPMPEGKKIYAVIPKDIMAFWLTRYPSVKPYLSTDGRLYVQLTRFLYGLAEAPHQFNLMLDKKLREIGFNPTSADPCFYTRTSPHGTSMISVHVDDLLVTSPNDQEFKKNEQLLDSVFDLNRQYDDLSYISLNILKSKDGIKVSQQGMIEKIVKKFMVTPPSRPPSTPCGVNFLIRDPTSPLLNEKEKKTYLSLVMSLMYPARLTRPDILFPTTVLATFSSRPTEEDRKRLSRVLHYLASTKDEYVLFTPSDMKLRIYCDASYLLHEDGLGHGGMILTLGSAPVYCRSWKHSMATRSSSEAELVTVEESVTYLIWMRRLLKEIGYSQPTTPIYQDNLSTILMATQGGSFRRTKHLIGKERFLLQYIEAGEARLRHLPTKEMIADILTKPLAFASMQRLMELLHDTLKK
jgi:hypothetical protein